MARPSKIDRLPQELRDAIGDLRRQGRTIDEILAHLRSLGVGDVSRTGLGEHIKKWDAVAKRLNESRAAAESIMSRMENAGADDRMMRFNVQMLHASLMELQRGEDGEPAQLDPKEAAQIAKAIKDLSAAARSDQVRYMEARKLLEQERLRVAALSKAVDDTAAALSEGGISGERAAELRRKLLGVRQKPPSVPPVPSS
jgi:hypothetical protein